MKKKVLLIAIGSLLLLSIIGCGKTQKESEYSNVDVQNNEALPVISDVEAEENVVSENETDATHVFVRGLVLSSQPIYPVG